MTSKRILVVDDEPSMLLTLAANLELEGFEVLEAASGAEALVILETRSVDLVLSDVRMPGLSGLDLYRAIRQRGVDAPFVLMTAFALEDMLLEAVHEGVFAVLPKPFDPELAARAFARAMARPLVLIVDDEEAVAATTVDALRCVGLRAAQATDADAAVALVKTGEVDVAVVDMVMAATSGPEILERIRTIDPSIAFIGVSGHDVPEMFRQIAAQAHALMRKPIKPADLLATIAHARGRRAVAGR